ncbi:molecular chaperone GrpE [Rhodovulum iodosum]|uniref:Protein GrpE n=1 Tax=Rhodovulum iodosum TaxID=68291 RepID=A0ABV3XRM5_9RHOB|nr:nucleotide exchange factor GrpE [Rhodovulum robiginosum]RSK30330.1 nucleotide exchange factor GrpE [Rhodovulum robiginosum]
MAEAKKDDSIDIDEQAEADAPDLAEAGAQEDEYETLRAERDELRDRFMRALADAENARKRGERDRREAEQYGGSKLARDMLPVYDHLSRALDVVSEEQREANKAFLEGVELTLRELLNVFAKHGIERLAPQEGDTFDPQLHQAMFEAPVPGTKAGEIIQVMTVGFMLHDRLLRPAQVGVSSTPAG